MSADASLIAAVSSAPARRAARLPVTVAIAMAVLCAVVILVICGDLLPVQDPLTQNLSATLQTPSGAHLLGTDQIGRDVLARVVAGARASVVGPLVVASGCAVVGGALGLLAGYSGGLADATVSRVVDIMYALPGLLVVIVIVGVVGGGYWLTAVVLIALGWPYQARLCRSATLAQSRLTYVDAARTIGFRRSRILRRHVLPNIFPIILTTFMLDFVGAVIGYAALAYLGLGATNGSPDWGSMIAAGQDYITSNPWISLAPALALVAMAASVTLVGDWAYERLSARRGVGA
jgi:peptide/nickel transport system permease protein